MAEAANDLLRDSSRALATSISDRLSQELVIVLVGPVASGVSTAGHYIRDILAQQFGYDVAPTIKLSDIIRSEAHRVSATEPPKKPLGEYITAMQNIGNELRRKFGTNYLAEKVVERIVKFREGRGGYSKEGHVILPGRRAYVIDSIKNIEELQLLRKIYRDTLCLVGVFAPDAVRKQRLENNGTDPEDIQRVLDRDQGEPMTFGQMTRNVFVEADFFICNDHKEDELRQDLFRYFEIIFDTNIHTPTRAETAMYEAEAAAATSACMSRQVGAALVSKTGELISVGRNDVPKFGGGLYTEDDQSTWNESSKAIEDQDHRCFRWKQKICHNDTRRNGILDQIVINLIQSGVIPKTTKQTDLRTALLGTGVDSLTEFSRSIHAEMEAILAIAREGRHSLVGSTLYTTTYPCHNCARHIVAAGIASVIYVQPYKKSLAIALHGDAITEDVADKSRVVFRQYDGVAPRNYLRMFRPIAPRKEGGKVFRPKPGNAMPIFRVLLDGFDEYESKVIADLASKEQSLPAGAAS